MSNPDYISKMSYTSRDFNTIYPELLDIVKKLTYKWDPSISNESDPGVILLKLNAIIGDKLNYNIDKNVLECFPESVTQQANARQLYSQLGYFMHWYRSATTDVTLYWSDFDNFERSNTTYYRIPKFTMVTDYDSDIVYTLVGLSGTELNAATDLNLYQNGEPISFSAIQGIAVQYDINGETSIQASNLDTNNRLYFTTNDVAENGIFITNVGENNYASWIRKDNLGTENQGNTFYSFGVLPNSNTCYIEFPEDAETIFKNGINITYIRTNGQSGNIPRAKLEKFYVDFTADRYVNGDRSDSTLLNTSNVAIINVLPGTGGEDEESLEDAYRNFKHTIGTFDTLITLRDYMNAIINSPQLASNAVVSDRSNDIQCSYKIMSLVNNIDMLVNNIDQHDDKPAMTSFDLKLYVLQYATIANDENKSYNYAKTFNLTSDKNLTPIELYLENQKAIPHDYSKILTPYPGTYDENDSLSCPDFRSHICMFKNVFPIDCRVTPTRTLDDAEKKNLKDIIQTALYQKLNSSKLDFGESIDAYTIETIIEESDERIASASIGNINFKTYAVYWNGTIFKDIILNPDSADEDYIYTYSRPILSQMTIPSVTIDEPWGIIKCEYDGSNWDKYPFDYDTQTWGESTETISITGTVQLYVGDTILIEKNPAPRFRDEIYVKSILAGTTPLYKRNTEFRYSFNQDASDEGAGIVDNVENIYSYMEIPSATSYVLKDNENIRFTSVNLDSIASYGGYTRYYLYTAASVSITANSNYMLGQGECLYLFYQEASGADFSYALYGEGNIICPTFSLTSSTTNPSDLSRLYNAMNLSEDHRYNSNFGTPISSAENTYVTNNIRNWLTTDNTITLKDKNEIDLTSNYLIYWVLNNKTDDNKYVLEFNEGTSNQYYILDSEEYLFVKQNEKSPLKIFGAGTRIERPDGTYDEWSVPAADLSFINSTNGNSLSDIWFIIPENVTLTVKEQEYIILGSGCSVTFSAAPGVITSIGETDLGNKQVSYLTPGASEPQWLADKSSVGGWSAHAILSINVGSGKSQAVLENQKIFINEMPEPSDIGDDPGDVAEGQCFQCSMDINETNASGEYTAHTITYDDIGNEVLNLSSVYIYSEAENSASITYGEDRTSIMINSASGNAPIAASLPADQDYIFSIYNQYDNFGANSVLQLQVYNETSSSWVAVHPKGMTSGNIKNQGTYYYVIPNTQASSLDSFRLYWNSLPASPAVKYIIINEIIQYDIPEEISDKFADYNTILENFDPENKFDYGYVIPDDNLIENPLLPESFLDNHHIYNSYTICEIDAKESGQNYKFSLR